MIRKCILAITSVAFLSVVVFISSAQYDQTECLEITTPSLLYYTVEDEEPVMELDYNLCASLCLSYIGRVEYIAAAPVYFETCLLMCFIVQDELLPIISDGVGAFSLPDFGAVDIYGSTDSKLSSLNRHLVITDSDAILYHVSESGEVYNEDLLWQKE